TSSDEPDEGQFGYAGGIEGSIDVNIATLYGKLGYAHAPNEGGVDDEGFFGAFVEGGAIFSLSNEFAVQVSAGYGYSEPFETDDETGYYATWGIKGAYNLGTDLNINLVASYEGLYSAGLEDDESVLDHTF